jgi:hypothetical protein
MNDKSYEFFSKRRKSFERSLEKSLAALDRSHYPPSLLKSMELILNPPRKPVRGLPLLVECLAAEQGSNPRGQVPVAAEVLLRGFLLLAEMGLDRSCRPETALGQSLGKHFSQAHLLLTADTMLTWPMELVAGETDSAGGPLVGIFSRLLGADKVLDGLDSAQPDLEGLLSIQPVEALARAVTAGRDELGKVAVTAARWIYLREIESWFGVRISSASHEMQMIENRLYEAADDSSSAPAMKQVSSLIGFLNKSAV